MRLGRLIPFIIVEARPLIKLAPALFCKKVFLFSLIIEVISLPVVVFPFVPVTTITFVFELSRTFLIKFGFSLSAICPGQVEPEPKFKKFDKNIIVLPRRIEKKLIY